MTEPTPLFAVPALVPLPPPSVGLDVHVEVDLARLIRANQEAFDAEVAKGRPPSRIVAGWIEEAMNAAVRSQPESISFTASTETPKFQLRVDEAVEAAKPTYPKCRVGDPPPLYGSASGS